MREWLVLKVVSGITLSEVHIIAVFELSCANKKENDVQRSIFDITQIK